jgi:hypothetical protein
MKASFIELLPHTNFENAQLHTVVALKSAGPCATCGGASAAFKLFGGLFSYKNRALAMIAGSFRSPPQRTPVGCGVGTSLEARAGKIFSVIGGALTSRATVYIERNRRSGQNRVWPTCELSHTWANCHYFS